MSEKVKFLKVFVEDAAEWQIKSLHDWIVFFAETSDLSVAIFGGEEEVEDELLDWYWVSYGKYGQIMSFPKGTNIDWDIVYGPYESREDAEAIGKERSTEDDNERPA